MIENDKLDKTFAALADPTRRAILARLASGESSVQELAKPFKMSLPAVSKHLKVLERAKLIGRTRTAQWRPCYLNPEPLRKAFDWMEQYRRFWDESFERLDEILKALQTETIEPVKGPKKKKKSAGGKKGRQERRKKNEKQDRNYR